MLEEVFKDFNWTSLALFVVFALPGFISLRVWSLITPVPDRNLRDELFDAVGFGVLNAAVTFPAIASTAKHLSEWGLYFALFFSLVVLPSLWPFAIRKALSLLQLKDLILMPTRNAWDGLFLRREPFFVIVHLKDGRRIGGFYGKKSISSLYPNSGYLYIESLWRLDKKGRFLSPIPGSRGIILRPEDYNFIELLEAN